MYYWLLHSVKSRIIDGTRAESDSYSVSNTREAKSDAYSVSSARATPTLSAAPGTAESVSYSVSSAVESRASLIVLVTIHGGCKVSRSESHSDYTRLALRQR